MSTQNAALEALVKAAAEAVKAVAAVRATFGAADDCAHDWRESGALTDLYGAGDALSRCTAAGLRALAEANHLARP